MRTPSKSHATSTLNSSCKTAKTLSWQLCFQSHTTLLWYVTRPSHRLSSIVRELLTEAKDSTGSRGDVVVVRTSKPVQNLWKNGLFWSRYSFVTHSIDRKPRDWGFARSATRPSVTLRVTCRAPARIWLAVIDFQKSIWVRQEAKNSFTVDL